MNRIKFKPTSGYCGTLLKATVMAVLLMVAARLSVSAQDIVSVKITTSTDGYTNTMYAGDYAGAPGVRTNNWNNILVLNGNSQAYYTNYAGTISNAAGNIINGLQVAVYYGGGGSDGYFNRTAPTTETNDGKMFGDVADVYGNNSFSGFGYFDITNIPYANYDIYCYFRPDNGTGSSDTRGGFFLITNTPSGFQRYYLQNQTNSVVNEFGQLPDPSSSGSNYIQSTTTAIPSGGAAWSSIQGGNYVVFTGLTNSYTRVWFNGLGNGSGAKDDLGNYVNGGSTAVRFKVPSFQIVEVNLGAATNLFFGPSTSQLHAGDPVGTQSALFSVNAAGVTNNVSVAATNYVSSNPEVVSVSAAGLLTPGTNGTAQVVGYFQGLAATDTVTVVGPTSLAISVANTNLLAGNGQGDTTTATLLATFSDATNVVVNSFDFVSFGVTPTDVASASTNGIVTALAPGTFSVTGTYDGLSVTTNSVGLVTSWTNVSSVPSFAVKLTSAGQDMSFHDLAGAPGVRSGYWNNFVQSAFGYVTNQLDGPVDYQGNSLSGTLVQLMPNDPQDQAILSAGTPTTNESTLFDSWFDQGMNNGTTLTSQIVVSNIPYSSYDVYFYVYNDNSASGTNRPGEFIIDGVSQYRINNPNAATQPDNNGNGYVLASPQSGSLPASIVDVPYGNVVKFSGITDNILNVQWGGVGQDLIGDASSVTRLRLVGFQIVESLDGLTATNLSLATSVPVLLPGNPASFALTVLADFTSGTKNGNITDLPSIAFSSSNTNIFNVDTNGDVTPGLTPGSATLTVTYQTNTLTQIVTTLPPISVTVQAVPDTVYLDSTIGVEPAQAEVFATFAGYTNVNVSAFNSVSFVDQGAAAASLSASGAITANAYGTANLGAAYLGTTNVSTNAFTVASIANAPVLKHEYNFTNLSQVIDSVGGANGTIYAPLSDNKPITLDGARAIFPGDGNYTDEPYIALPSGIIGNMGDVSIEIWCGQSQLETWARFFGFGNTPKGSTPYALGGSATSGLQLITSYPANSLPDFNPIGLNDFFGAAALTNGSEYQFVLVYAPNAGQLDLYINGVLITNSAPAAEYLNTFVNDTVDWLGVSLSNNDPPLAGWINNLAIYEGVMPPSHVASDYAAGQSIYLPPATVAINSIPVGFSISGGNLNLSWPPDHLGWTLQVQTNSLNAGLGTNWITVAGSTSVTNEVIPITQESGAVFYRLVYP
jgi:hypothetical protein